MIKVSPSIMTANYMDMRAAVENMSKWGADMIHCDVTDGTFVPSISFGQQMIRDMRACTKLPLDVHLMIDKPERYIDEFVDAGADILTIHAEATLHLDRVLKRIKELGVKVGVALCPSTPPEALKYVLPVLDMITILSVNPGFSGSPFVETSYKKLKDTRALIEGYGIALQCDGGVNLKNAARLVACGADILVSGSCVFRAEDPAATIAALQRADA